MAHKLIANGKEYLLKNPPKICLGFCLFDGSYPKYDEPLNKPIEELSVPYGEMRARTPRDGKEIQAELNMLKPDVYKVKQELDRYEQGLDNLTDEEWQHCRDKLVKLMGKMTKIYGISESVATKTLHRHFRNLLPLVDNECVRNHHGYRGNIEDVFDQIRQDMIDSKDVIDNVEDFLNDRIQTKLTRLRIFDILLFSLMRSTYNKVKMVL